MVGFCGFGLGVTLDQPECCVNLNVSLFILPNYVLDEHVYACLSIPFRFSQCAVLSTARAAGILPMKSNAQLRD